MPSGTAEAPQDYSMMSANLEFPTNSTDGVMECMNFNITDNDAFELNETFIVTLTVNTAGVMVGNTETTITIMTSMDDCKQYIFKHGTKMSTFFLQLLYYVVLNSQLPLMKEMGLLISVWRYYFYQVLTFPLKKKCFLISPPKTVRL